MQPTSKPSISQDLVNAARQTLEAIPPPPKVPKLLRVKDAIKALTPTIRKLLQRGFSREQVVALLGEQGIDCSLATLKNNYRVKPSRPTKASSTSTGPQTMASTGRKTDASTLPASSAAANNGAPLTPGVTSPTQFRSPTVTGTAVQKSIGPSPIAGPTLQATKVP